MNVMKCVIIVLISVRKDRSLLLHGLLSFISRKSVYEEAMMFPTKLLFAVERHKMMHLVKSTRCRNSENIFNILYGRVYVSV